MNTPIMRTRETCYERIKCQNEDGHLFAVREGIRADLAVQGASALLHAGIEALRSALCDQPVRPESGALWSALHALESGTAIVDSLTFAIEEAAES